MSLPKFCSLISVCRYRNCHSSPYLQVLMVLVHKFMLKDTFKFFFPKFVVLSQFLVCTWDIMLATVVVGLAGQWAPMLRWAEVTPLPEQLGCQCALSGAQPAFACLPSAIGCACLCPPARAVRGGWAAQRGCGSVEPAPELLGSMVRTLKLHFLFLQSFRKAENIN